MLRSLQIQKEFLLEKSIFLEFPYNLHEINQVNSKYKNNFIIRNLLLMNENNFNIKNDRNEKKIKNNYIRGDNILIRKILDKKFYINNFFFFKKYNLIFLNQITHLDRTQILGESFLKRRKNFNDVSIRFFR
jgi:hypothetical protein